MISVHIVGESWLELGVWQRLVTISVLRLIPLCIILTRLAEKNCMYNCN